MPGRATTAERAQRDAVAEAARIEDVTAPARGTQMI